MMKKLRYVWNTSGFKTDRKSVFPSVVLKIGLCRVNRTGHYCPGERVTIKLEHPLFNQIDGNEGWCDDSFTFTVLPNALKIKF